MGNQPRTTKAKQGLTLFFQGVSHIFFSQPLVWIQTEVWKKVLEFWTPWCAGAAVYVQPSCRPRHICPSYTCWKLAQSQSLLELLPVSRSQSPASVASPGNSAGFLWHFNWHTSCYTHVHTHTHFFLCHHFPWTDSQPHISLTTDIFNYTRKAWQAGLIFGQINKRTLCVCVCVCVYDHSMLMHTGLRCFLFATEFSQRLSQRDQRLVKASSLLDLL